MARTIPINTGFTIINGSGTGTNGNRIDVWAEYKLGTQSLSGNYTPITVHFYAALSPGYQSSTAFDRGLDSALKVDGKAGTGVSNGAYSFESVNNVNLLGSFNGNIAHNTDGTKTVSIQGSFTTLSSYISGGSVTANIKLPSIPRASTLGATAANIGETSLIAVSVKSPSYTHSIAYSFGSLSGYITAAGQITNQETKFSSTSIPFTVPESFYAQIPNAKTGVCTLTCKTYAGNTQIGNAQTAEFSVTAKESACKPEVTGTVVDVNPDTFALTGDEKTLVRYFSTARCTISAQAKNSASIAQKKIGGIVVTGDSLDIANVQSSQITFYAADSRGYSDDDVDELLSVVNYVQLSNLASISRDDPTSGNATIKLNGSFYKGGFGVVDNALTVSYSVNGGEPVTVTPEITYENSKYAGLLQLSGLDYAKAHTVDLTVQDALMKVSRSLSVQKGIPVFDWGENDFRFNVPVAAPSFVGAVSGVHMRVAKVWNGKSTIKLQTRFTSITSGGARQSLFLFGSVNGTLINGVIGVDSSSVTAWSGTNGVSVGEMDISGKIDVTLPQGAYDYFVLISAYEFEVL